MWLVVIASAYCVSGITATGTPVHPGTVAVDPRVIPLRSRLLIPGYGRGVALDTGGSIKGNRIDLWMGECSAARRWGVRRVRIHVN